MKTYYQDELVCVYHGDCREIMSGLSPGAIITDPPYGIDHGQGGNFKALHGWGKCREKVAWDVERPPREIFDAILKHHVPTVIWGGNYFTDYLPPSMGWIAWDKGQRNFSLADFELAWTSEKKAARCVVMSRSLALKDGKTHPTQKPIWVMKQCVDFLERGRKEIDGILDPFAGSGSTVVAAKELGKHAIAIEIDEAYCETIARRLAAVTPYLFSGHQP